MKEKIQKTVGKINDDKPGLELNTETKFELDENELKRYLDIVIKEVKAHDKSSLP